MNSAMGLFFLMLFLPVTTQMSTTEEYNLTDTSNATDYPYDYTGDSLEGKGQTQEVALTRLQDTTNLRVYKGPLPKFPGTTVSPWIALHSPVRMYIPIRNTGINSAESADCVQCPKNLIVYLPPYQIHILTPVPTISICSSFAERTGRVHVAVISGPRPGQSLTAGRYQVELMVWKAEGPVHSCKYNITIKGKRLALTTSKKIPCPKPEQPPNGIVLCDPSDRKYYSHDSVCQVFCLIGYLVENSTTNSSTVVCKNGRWSPENHVSCVATFCPNLPRSPTRGSWDCRGSDSNTGFGNGTFCDVSCEPGYVVLTSELELATASCIPPFWNYSDPLPECKRSQLPKLLNCHDRHLIVRSGHTVKVSPHLLPTGTSHSGEDVAPACSLQRKNLPRGKHQNICEVTDPELRTTRKCSYGIHIEESSGPQPHTGDCKNRTVFANRKGVIHSKPVRFIIKVGEPARNQVHRGNCKPKGDLQVGTHSIVCKATDPYTKVVGTCSYWLNIREKSCPPLLDIPNGRIVCSSHAIGAVCHYECDAGYAIPMNHLSRAKKLCHSNMSWKPILDPVCKIKPPELVEGCDDLEVELSPSNNFTVPLPSFLTALNETLNATCTPNYVNTVGQHQVGCVVADERFNVSCNFNITVVLKDEATTMAELPTTEIGRPQLVEGCNDLEVNMSSPVNYTVPVPQFTTSTNETLAVLCSPSLISLAGQYPIRCTAEDDSLEVSCSFTVEILLRDEPTTISSRDIERLQLAEGCNDVEVNMSSPFHYTVPVPRFMTATNKTPIILCSPTSISVFGQHAVKCIVAEDDSLEVPCSFIVTVLPKDEPTTTLTQETPCEPLSPPLHGSITCTAQGITESCQVTCDPGYGFSEDNSMSVACIGGLWDFQKPDVNRTLPDCFAQVEGSAVEVWLSFEAFAPHCEEELEEQIKDLVNDLCQFGTDCSKITINCTLDEESDMMNLVVNWTVEADFNDEEYYESEEIPEAEIRLESVMENTRSFLSTEDIPGNVHLFRDSFRRGLITLVCPDGFIPNMLMAKCIQCPKEKEHSACEEL